MPLPTTDLSRRRKTLLAVGAVAVIAAPGVTGSGQRDGGVSAEDDADTESTDATESTEPTDGAEATDVPGTGIVSEVGSIVADTYTNLEADLPEDTSINMRAVDYPAMSVPLSLKKETWQEYFESVAQGMTATEETINGTVEECPLSKVVVVGYSQGAMAARRALLDLGPVDNIVAGVLIGDGDKLPDDQVSTISDYGTDDYRGISQMAKSEWNIDSGGSDEPLPAEWDSRILSACRDGDVVCALDSFNLGTILDDISAHTNYDAEDWRQFLAENVTG